MFIRFYNNRGHEVYAKINNWQKFDHQIRDRMKQQFRLDFIRFLYKGTTVQPSDSPLSLNIPDCDHYDGDINDISIMVA